MALITDLTRVSDDAVNTAIRAIRDIVNGRIDMFSNLSAKQITVSLDTANEIVVANPFRSPSGKLPGGWYVIDATSACSLRRGSTPWTTNSLYFVNQFGATGGKCTVLFLPPTLTKVRGNREVDA